MRTTVDLDEQVLAAARAIARDEHVSMGAAISRLALAGLRGSRATVSGVFPTFTPPENAPPITLDRVNEFRDDA